MTNWPKMDNATILHQTLIDRLKRRGYIRAPLIEAAFRATPRHLFLPEMALDKVYRDQAIAVKRVGLETVSSSSQPGMMAIMLEQLDLRPGQRVLEIGAGTGYNAALMAHIVGETGRVVTVDIDEDMTAKARCHLAAAGFETVEVVRGDGGFGYLAAAPYDRIILTVGVGDIAPAWWEQLKPQGRMVLPLSIKGPQLSIAFEPAGDHLVSLSVELCGFVRLRGVFAGADRSLKVSPALLMSLVNLAPLLKRLGLTQPAYWLERLFGPDEALAYRILERLMGWRGADHPATPPIRIRSYAGDMHYTPTATETVVAKERMQFVLEWE